MVRCRFITIQKRMPTDLFTSQETVPAILALITELKSMPVDDRVEALNKIKIALHEVSPFKHEPVDCVLWVSANEINANDYNPNSVAPPEMKLLEHSIIEDGYTQPIVAWKNGSNFEVVDGFHR